MELLRKRCIFLYIFLLLNLQSICVLTLVGANSVSFNSPLNNKLSFSSKEFRRLKGKGLEMMPIDEIASNTIGEPSCEELRAMWRYNKRQHRAAELSNQIPKLPNLFWDLPVVDQPRSFGMFRSRGSHSFRPKGSRTKQDKIFGRVLLSPAATSEPASQRKPLEEVVELLGKDRPVKVSKIKEPVVHLMEPVEPTPESNFQKLRNMYREERMKDGNDANAKNQKSSAAQVSSSAQGSSSSGSGISNVTPPTAFVGGKEFGRLVLSPPKGQDGRIANKPKELMSPFERLRFGQIDDLLGIKDEIEGKHVLTNFPVKRRNGFVGFPMLRQSGTMTGSRAGFVQLPFADSQSTQQTSGFRPPHLGSSRHLPAPVSSSSVAGPRRANMTYPSDDAVAAAFEDSVYVPSRDSILMNTNVGDLQVQNAIASQPDSAAEGQALLVEIPSCPEVEHQFCASNADCKCAGYGLYRCFHGECQVLSVYSEDSDDYDLNGGGTDAGNAGLWHTNSVPNSHLGLWDSSPFVDTILTEDDMKKRKRSA